MNDYFNWLDGRIDACRAEIAGLEAAGRRDDANFVKVRANIYDVCRTVSRVQLNRPGGGSAAVTALFARFGNEWGAALEKAKAHGDVKAVAVEETKLAALSEVTARFEEAAKS